MKIQTTERQYAGASRDTALPVESLVLTATSLKEAAFLRRLSQAMERNDSESALTQFRFMLFECSFDNKSDQISNEQ